VLGATTLISLQRPPFPHVVQKVRRRAVDGIMLTSAYRSIDETRGNDGVDWCAKRTLRNLDDVEPVVQKVRRRAVDGLMLTSAYRSIDKTHGDGGVDWCAKRTLRNYRRRSAKTSRAYPRKKQRRLIGIPQITRATSHQIALAHTLQQQEFKEFRLSA
jgi:hypothetical protein